MSNTNENNVSEGGRARRGSFTQQTFQNIFARSNSISSPSPPFPGPITTAAVQDQRRRTSITTLGLSGNSPSNSSPFPFVGRRGSVSTAGSDSVDENAIDDDDTGRSAPSTPFARRMSFGAQAMRSVRGGGGSPNTSGRAPSYNPSSLPAIPSGPRSSRAFSNPQNDGVITPPNQASTQSKPRIASDLPVSARPGEGNGFSWSEQLRSRAESQSQRASFSTSPNTAKTVNMPTTHDRARSISDIPAPPTAVPAARARPERKQPDAFQERILKGDFYMD